MKDFCFNSDCIHGNDLVGCTKFDHRGMLNCPDFHRIDMNKPTDPYQARLDAVNKSTSVWDSIDRPMRRLVFELHRIGMLTKFSCFGFPYDGEEEPKSHHGGTSYVHFYVTKEASSSFGELCSICNGVGVSLRNAFVDHPSIQLSIYNTVPNLYQKTDGLERTIHEYEASVLIIRHLCYLIQENISTLRNNIKIVDGNGMYREYDEWQIKPKPDYCISVDDFYKEHGKLSKPLSDVENVKSLYGDDIIDIVIKNQECRGILMVESVGERKPVIPTTVNNTITP